MPKWWNIKKVKDTLLPVKGLGSIPTEKEAMTDRSILHDNETHTSQAYNL